MIDEEYFKKSIYSKIMERLSKSTCNSFFCNWTCNSYSVRKKKKKRKKK